MSKNLTNVIPKRFYEINDYDHFNRLLVGVYLRQSDMSWIRGRLALVKAGNVFKTVNALYGTEHTDGTLYRAISDAMYDKKDDQVIVECTTLEEYEEEVSLQDYTFTEPNYDPCRD